MSASTRRVVLDANVLFPASLRDTLLRLAERGIIDVFWSDEILEELRRNLLDQDAMEVNQAARLVDVMNVAFPAAGVTGYERHIAKLKNDPKDRHVLAVALEVKAGSVVTFNTRDFTPSPDGIAIAHPAPFLQGLLRTNPDDVLAILREQAESLKRPPMSLDELLRHMEGFLPEFATSAREALRDE